VAAAYFLAAPRLVGVRAEQLSAYLVAPYAVIAGLAGSVLITAVRVRTEGPARTRPAAGDEPAGADRYRTDPYGEDVAPVSPVPDRADAPTGGLPRQRPGDLPDDGYAPARAYASDTPAEPAAEPAGARGQAAVPAPLWPDDPTGEGPTNPRRGRRDR
jgi:hypothetical protein